MLRSIKELQGYRITTRDDEIGKVHDFLFDDREWVVRYLVVNTGRWLDDRLVLVPPHVITSADWAARHVAVDMTKEQIESSPPIDLESPVSRQQEIELYAHYGWQPYWPGTATGIGLVESAASTEVAKGEKRETPSDTPTATAKKDPHLRSAREVTGYHISAADGEIGHINDWIVDDENWTIRYAVVDTRNWLPGRKVLVAIPWFQDVSWERQAVTTELTQETIKNSPEFDPDVPINREYEQVLYDFYGRKKYWS